MTHTIGIIGFGRFGRVIHRLFDSGFEVRVSSSRMEKGVVEGVVFDTLEAVVSAADAVFLTVPINRTFETALRIKPFLRPGQVVVDVCSVKEMPNNALEAALEDTGVTIWPTHPMFGPDSTQSGFDGLVWVSCEDALDPEVIASYTAYLERKGLILVRTTCAEHDRMAARTQGLTHFIGRFLDELKIAPTPIDTLGYRRLMAVRDQTCNDTWELFCDLQYFNRFSGDMHQSLLDAVFKVLSRFLDTTTDRETLLVGVLTGAEKEVSGILAHAAPNGVQEPYSTESCPSIEEILRRLFLGTLDFGVFKMTVDGELDVEVLNAIGAYAFHVTALFKDDRGETAALVKRRRWSTSTAQ